MTLPRLRVRPAAPWDNAAKQRLLDRAWIVGHGQVFPATVERFGKGQRPVEAHSYQIPEDGSPWVADIAGGQILGVMDLRPQENSYLMVEPIATDPNFHRQGIGRVLSQHAEQIAAARGDKGLQVWAVDGNGPANEFYKAMRCKAAGKGTVSFDGVVESATMYERSL